MTESKTSSATQLYQILNSAYACDGKMIVKAVWQEVLQFDSDRDRTVENKYIELIKLFSCVKSDLEEIAVSGVNTEKYFLAIDTILSGLCIIPFNGQWQLVKNQINLPTLHLVDSCGEVLIASGRGLNKSSPEKVNDILTSVHELIAELEISNISNGIKTVLIQKLKRIEIALNHHQVFGTIELKQATEQSLGEMIIIAEQLPKNDMSEILRNNIVKIIDVLSKCNSVYTLGEKISPNFNNFVHHLPTVVNSVQNLLAGH
jgi:hypothetical protein